MNDVVEQKTEEQAPPQDTTAKVGALTIDLAGVFPLKVGDWRKLEAKGISPDDVNAMLDERSSRPVTIVSAFIQYVCGKVDSRITAEYLDELSVPELYDTFLQVIRVRGKSAVNRPT